MTAQTEWPNPKKRPNSWCAELGYNPDSYEGWRDLSFEEPITLSEFLTRMSLCRYTRYTPLIMRHRHTPETHQNSETGATRVVCSICGEQMQAWI